MEENLSVASVAQPVQRIPETQRREAEEQSVYAQIGDPRRQETLEIQRLRDEVQRIRRRNSVLEECLRFILRMQELGEPVPSMEFLKSGIPPAPRPPPAVSARVTPPRRTQEPIRVKTRGQPPIRAPSEVAESRPLPKRRAPSPLRPLPKRRAPSPLRPLPKQRPPSPQRPLPKRRPPSPQRPLPKQRIPSPPRLNRGHSGKTRDYRSPERVVLPREAVQGTNDRERVYTGAFTKWMWDAVQNSKLELPKFRHYDAKSRPHDHIYYYKTRMDLITNDEAWLCIAFLCSLGR